MTHSEARAKLIQHQNEWAFLFFEMDNRSRVYSAADLYQKIEADQIEMLMIDLQAQGLLGSDGVRFLLELQEECNDRGCKLTLHNIDPKMKDLFRVLQLNRVFNIKT